MAAKGARPEELRFYDRVMVVSQALPTPRKRLDGPTEALPPITAEDAGSTSSEPTSPAFAAPAISTLDGCHFDPAFFAEDEAGWHSRRCPVPDPGDAGLGRADPLRARLQKVAPQRPLEGL